MTTTVSQSASASGSVASSSPRQLHHQIVVVGGGAAGITVAAQLFKRQSLDVAIIEPSDKHYYQPAWTLVGGGAFKFEDTVREEADCLPKGTTWIQDFVTELDPDRNRVITREGTQISYDYLILCPGIQIDWHLVKGLKEALGKGNVTSNYSALHTQYTWEAIQNFKGGTAIFTFPNTPIKCGGAPQKIMYLADDVFKSKSGVGVNTKVLYCTATPKMFPVPEYCQVLEQVVARRGIEPRYQHNLKQINADTQEAIFDVTTAEGVQEVSIHYDLLHVAPPMSAPDFIKKSPLAQNVPGGWVDVDKATLQHVRYPNVFSLGDASSLPTSKTAAAIRKQAPVLIDNLLAVMASGKINSAYDGYTCCPLVTGYNSLMMAEFGYDNKLDPSFPLNPAKERWSMWLLKKYALPWLYWNRMLKGAGFESDRLKNIFGK